MTDAPSEPLARLHRLRDQLAAEHAKAVAADQQPRPDLDHLHVTAHNGIAVGLEIAVGLADHHLREAGGEARTTLDNPPTSGEATAPVPCPACQRADQAGLAPAELHPECAGQEQQ